MQNRKATVLALALLCVLATACSLPGIAAPTPTPFILPSPLPTIAVTPSPTGLLIPTSLTSVVAGPAAGAGTQVVVTRIVVPQAAATQYVSPAEFCADAQPTTLISSLQTAVQTSNGELLASLISPVKGMEARLYRDGRLVTYDRAHAKFLFESTYSVDWGRAPGSGMMTSGAFHDTILPDLKDVFSKTYTLKCNEIQVGGTTYTASWPYTGVNYYSAYYPGTTANSNMDWHTWLLGMQYINGKPFLSAIMQFKWEP
jgi:hypothetical protein